MFRKPAPFGKVDVLPGAQHPMVGPWVPAGDLARGKRARCGAANGGHLSRPTAGDQWWRRSSVGCSHLVHRLWPQRPLLCASAQAPHTTPRSLQPATFPSLFDSVSSLHFTHPPGFFFSHSLSLRQVPKETPIINFSTIKLAESSSSSLDQPTGEHWAPGSFPSQAEP